MDYYQSWIEMLANDIILDKRGFGIQFVDRQAGGEVFIIDIPDSEVTDLEQVLTDGGVTFAHRFCHTIEIFSYPANVKLQRR